MEWRKPDALPNVLYGDTSQDTHDAMAFLRDRGVAFQLSLYHDCLHVPALSTASGVARGLSAIKRIFSRRIG